MADLLTGPHLAQGGAVAILAVVVLMVLTGRLVPRSVLRDRTADWRERLVESQRAVSDLQAANAELVGAVGDLAKQVDRLTTIGRTTEAMLTSLRQESPA